MKVEISDVHDDEMLSFLHDFANKVKNNNISVNDFNDCLKKNKINFYLSVDEQDCYVCRGYSD